MSDETKEVNTKDNALDLEGKFLTFELAEQEYGIDILRVVEIVGLLEITSIPRTPNFVKGVINLRGKIIPVMDLRLKFDLSEDDYDQTTCIIVTEIEGAEGTFQMGIIVDTVSEVIEVNSECLERTPAFGGSFNPDYILAMAKIKGKVKTLLDINGILSDSELSFIEQM